MIFGDNAGDNPLPSISAIMQSGNLYGYCMNDPVNFVDSNGRWKADVHYNDTYAIARELGFDEEDANIIAYSDNYVDKDPKTQPITVAESNLSWHFDRNEGTPDTRAVHSDECMQQAIKLARSAKRRGDSEMMKRAFQTLGKGLHPLQDMDAHGNWAEGEKIVLPHGIPFEMQQYDDTNYDWASDGSGLVWTGRENSQRYQETLRATKQYIQTFLDAVK